MRVEKGKDPFKEDDFCALNVQAWGITLAGFVVVVRDNHILAREELSESLSNERPIHGIRVVEIVRPDLLILFVS
jgi:hypothetical protein